MRALHVLGSTFFLLTMACFNSQWGEAKGEQQRAMVRAAPPQLERIASTGAVTPVTISVHVLATPRYTSQVVDAPRQFQEAVNEVNRVFSGLGVTFRVDSFAAWETAEDRVETALAALESKENAGPLDLHVGLLGSLPRASASFHELGYATLLGHHLVLRAPARADEVDAIERNLDELSAEEREGLVKGRRKHRAAALLLHEIGHTLGAIHDDAAPSVMNPAYANERSGFSPQNAALVEITLRHRAAKEASSSELARDLLASLDKVGSGGDFVAKDRDEMRVLLTSLRAPTTAPSPSPSPAVASASANTSSSTNANTNTNTAPPATEEDLRDLAAGDRETYRRVEALLTKHEPAAAWEAGKALFASRAKSFTVQDLKCRVAMAAFAYDRAIGECETLTKLTREGLHK